VLIVGGGPVGMVLSQMLNKFKISNVILERTEENPEDYDQRMIHQNHPKAHYLGFRTCEILHDLGLGPHLDRKFDSILEWTNFNYQSHVLGPSNLPAQESDSRGASQRTDDVTTLGKVDHFKWFARRNKLPLPESKEDYLRLISAFKAEPSVDSANVNKGGFTYAYPNHFSQNILSSLLRDNLRHMD